MNLGLGNLTDLKRECLLAGDVASEEWDAALQDLGTGVAALFESYCGRKFGRVVDDVYEFDAYRVSYVMPRYPIEEIDSLAIRSTIAAGFIVHPDQPVNFGRFSGLVYFGGQLGTSEETVRVIYTGGYWFDESEDSSGTQPEGSELLPRDLKNAWLQQCHFFWDRRSIVERAKAGFAEGDGFMGGDSALLPTVVKTLDQYRRFNS